MITITETENAPAAVSYTPDQLHEIARRGALAALTDAGVLSKKDLAMAITNGTVAGVVITTASNLPTTPVMPLKAKQDPASAKPTPGKATVPAQEPTPEQQAAADKWALACNNLDPENLDAWERHRLLLRDGLPGISEGVKIKMFEQMVKAAYSAWIDYNIDNSKKFSFAPDKPKVHA